MSMREKAAKLLRDAHIVTMATVSAKNTPRCRIMATARVEDNADMWFATHAKSKKVAEIANNKACSISVFFQWKGVSWRGLCRN